MEARILNISGQRMLNSASAFHFPRSCRQIRSGRSCLCSGQKTRVVFRSICNSSAKPAARLGIYDGEAICNREHDTQFSSSVGTDPLPLSVSYTPRVSLSLLNVICCVAAVSASCLFIAAIPTLIAFKKAAESLERLLIVTREELPGTMAAIRLSGMEISDLTMELSDLGQDLTQGVRNSTRAFRVAEDRIRRMTNTFSIAYLQDQAKMQANIVKPTIVRTARSLHDKIVQGRNFFSGLLTLGQFTSLFTKYWHKRKRCLKTVK